MAAAPDIPLRIARDRLIDLLGIGDSYPLTDLEVIADPAKVPHKEQSTIRIERAQAGVTYELCDPKDNGEPLEGEGFKAPGDDAKAELKTPPMLEDVTYRIRATKEETARPDLGEQAPRLLKRSAPVKVGLNTKLALSILPAATPLLDPDLGAPSDPRLVPYGASLQVEVPDSQEGVEYALLLNGEEAPGEPVTGTRHAIVLDSGPLHEDAVIQVRATKRFAESLKRKPDVSLLINKLYVAVKADPALAVTLAPVIADYRQDATITIAATQKSARYLAFSGPVADADYVHSEAAVPSLVPAAGKPGLQVLKPALADAGAPAGFDALGEAAAGGSDVKASVKAPEEEILVLVQAIKEHAVKPQDPASRTVRSAVWLEQGAVVLVRPDPARVLALRLPLAGTQTGDSMEVAGGQPGVYYYFRPAPSGKEFGGAAYFHKRKLEQGEEVNKGLGDTALDGLAVEIDFAIAADPREAVADRAKTAPRLPQLDIAPLATGSKLALRAVKAQTGAEVPMALPAAIPAAPALRADPGIVDHGGTAKIVAVGEIGNCEFTLNGAPVKLPLESAALSADTILELVVTEPAAKGMKVECVARVPVLVRPDAGLAVAARADTVAKDAATEIVVSGSQSGVSYRLMAGSNPVGEAAAGTGTELALPTGPIAADTTFIVVATRADNAQLAAALKQQATVKVAAG